MKGHLVNHDLKLVEDRMDLCQPPCNTGPWANRSVEIVVFDLVCTLRSVLTELTILATDWPKVIHGVVLREPPVVLVLC